MQTLAFSPANSDFDTVVERAAEVLKVGKLVVVPTETVYGLAADATNGEAVAEIFETKQRPQFNPLIAHVSGIEMAKTIGVFNEPSQLLAEQFWPGPLTLIVEKAEGSAIHDLVSAGLDTIAIRCPDAGARDLIEAFGLPLAAPSANRSGHVSPSCAQHVVSEFDGRDLLILDGGPCEVGIESTIARADENSITILRSGSIDADQLAACTGLPVDYAQQGNSITAPGMMASHYAPRCKVILNCESANDESVMLAFGEHQSYAKHNLSPTGDLREAASNLYGMLRELDTMGKTNICVAPIPFEGLGIAINDRLSRAAAPRGLNHDLKKADI